MVRLRLYGCQCLQVLIYWSRLFNIDFVAQPLPVDKLDVGGQGWDTKMVALGVCIRATSSLLVLVARPYLSISILVCSKRQCTVR